MCGFLVSVGRRPVNAAGLVELTSALALLHHRGPDDTVVTRVGEGVVFGFQHLAIDRDGGAQPLRYPVDGWDAGRWTLVFDGEVYNFEALRAELTREYGAVFATRGDAEVVAAAYHYWGAKALGRLRGMFAFVLWDKITGTVHAVRDPFGIKPLHYLPDGDTLLLSSEKGPLLELADRTRAARHERAARDDRAAGDSAPSIDRTDIDRDALSLYLTMQYVPEPYALHRRIRRLEPGSMLTYRRGGVPRLERYQRQTLRPEAGVEPAVITGEIRDALRDSVRAHLRADVPVGAFLSSGIDSTALVALAREVDPGIRVFSAGFDVPGYSEIPDAQAAADHLGVTLVPTVVRSSDVMEALPRIMWHLDDPVADPSVVPLYFLARTAAEQVGVVLSGEGADELFGGYAIYREPAALAGLRGLPDPVQQGLRVLSGLIPEGMRGKSFLRRGTTPIEARYYGNARIFGAHQKARLLRGAGPIAAPTAVTSRLYYEAAALDEVAAMQHVDLHTWLTGDILTKADRMSMAHSLELRTPFLDQRVFEVARRLPTELKLPLGGDVTKYALRAALRGIVPPFVVDRPKLGFPTPTARWLRADLGAWAHDVFSSSGAGHLLDLNYAHALLVAHQRRDADHARKLWTVLMFCLWHAMVVERSITVPGHATRGRRDRHLAVTEPNSHPAVTEQPNSHLPVTEQPGRQPVVSPALVPVQRRRVIGDIAAILRA